MNDARPMIPLDDALAILDRVAAGLALEVERLPILEARGRHLAEDQHARLDLPPFDKSAMDGYAIAHGDRRDSYHLVGSVAAGGTPPSRLAPGTTVQVMTGAPVPPGTGRVVMQEHTEQDGERIRVLRHTEVRNVCDRAEDVRTGDRVLASGARLGPLEIANLVACGIGEVPVFRPARVEVFSTGDEIVDDPALLAPGRIMNSNGPMLQMLAQAHGLEVIGRSTVADRPDRTLRTLQQALERADLVIFSGGVSVGRYDFVLDAMEQAGLRLGFTRLAVKPGKPTVLGHGNGRLAFGLPGNPVSSFLMFHLFVLRAVARAAGGPLPVRTLRLRLGKPFNRRKTDRAQFVPCRLEEDATLAPVPYHGSAHLAAVLPAEGFFMVPVGVASLDAGATVDYLRFPRSMA